MPVAHFAYTAIDCSNARTLAQFYADLSGLSIKEGGSDDWVMLVAENGAGIAFQQIDDYVAPTWPGGEHPQQMHLDFEVDDLDEGELQVLALGATKHDLQPAPEAFRVYLDPEGHPFCLINE
jgi:hypothetical protein